MITDHLSVIARHSPSVIARHASAEAIPRLNPEQTPISNLKIQNPFGHWDFSHLILFSTSDLGFRTLFSGIATRSLP